jgi:hypothetical protein
MTVWWGPGGTEPDGAGWHYLGELASPVEFDLGLRHWYLAVCEDCTPRLPQPFSNPLERDEWVIAHSKATSHRVETGVEVR